VLKHLIAVDGISQVVRERGPQIQLVADDVGRELQLAGRRAYDAVEDKLDRLVVPPSVGFKLPKRSMRSLSMARSGTWSVAFQRPE
jgi:hypothetical protein